MRSPRTAPHDDAGAGHADVGPTTVGAVFLPAAVRQRVTDLPERTLGIGLMLMAAFGFSVMSLCVKLASAALPAMEIVFARSVFMAALTYGLIRQRGGSAVGVDRRTLLLRGGTGAVALSLLYVGLGRLPLGDAVTIHNTAPVWTSLTAALLLGERLRAGVVAGAAVCLGGVVFVARPSFLFGSAAAPLDGWAVAAVVVAALLSGVAYTFVRKLRATDDALTIIFYLSWMGAAVALPFAAGGGWRWPSAAGWALLLAVGLATQVGQVGLTHGLRRLEAGTATVIGYVQIVFAFGWGVLVFSDVPDPLSLAGAGAILASVLLLVRRS